MGPAGGLADKVETDLKIVSNERNKENIFKNSEVLKLVDYLKVNSEANSNTRYLANFDVCFNRKLIIEPQSPALINGVTTLTMTTPYESVAVIYNNNNWWTI